MNNVSFERPIDPQKIEKNQVFPEVREIIEKRRYLQEELKKMKKFDEITYKHSIETANLLALISKKIGLTGKEFSLIVETALAHDSGKLDIDPDVLFKKGKLTEEEWEEIRKHPRKSFDRINGHGRPYIAEMAVAHHDHNINSKSASRTNEDRRKEVLPVDFEKRSGFDRRKPDPQIMKLSRILAIVDSFEGLRSSRQYKKGFSLERCEEDLKEKYPTDEDKKVIEALTEFSK